MKIGLFGCTAANGNLGCVALTYALVQLLEKIRSKNQLQFKYILFEAENKPEKLAELCRETGVQPDHIQVCPLTAATPRQKVTARLTVYRTLRSCDCVLDITAGDSFTDIYGQKRFNYYTGFKRWVLLCKVPLLLMPQTYGPFNPQNRRIAAWVMNKCSLVLARDTLSKEFMQPYCKKEIAVTTDLAFRLPYQKKLVQDRPDRLQVGINVSDLLYRDGKEKGLRTVKFLLDYSQYTDLLIAALTKRQDIQVRLISHVAGDYVLAQQLQNRFPKVEVVPFFSNPIAAKTEIAGLDFFIGARMHATVAAVSAGVATVPIGYSRKFRGLFEEIAYPICLDMNQYTVQQAVNQTLYWLQEAKHLQSSAQLAAVVAFEKTDRTEQLLTDFMLRANSK